jgi:hypothetical protein
MVEQAEENLRRFKAKEPLIGHLMPYLTAEEVRSQGLPFDDQVGWVEAETAS